MLRKIQQFVNLTNKEKKLFLEAYMMLGIMRAAILSVSFKRLTHSLEHQKSKGEMTPLTDDEMQTATLVGQTVTRAAAHTPWESACLVQSLTAQKMLQKRGIPGVFHLGVAKDKNVEEKMKAHAWSQCGDVILTGAKGYEEFTVISTFEWGKE
ncbi:lasso peptide biosynthesis B2 protein [Sulfurovum sp. XTW-4]|uniref:Lasso peptide biosynthesis B2 protein n=1 Tax=Sulfurovum xiamenensis TaxID=3019066 RepID=A0ABT7QQB6_9BACT|nr:lasso peptide biosynthesis B2 protein [Sulfurovum xiamenensis]MDM5263039.1 lasso peptide biosynthesis B2 protein [Sulfurovum xiamenensis]